MPDYYHIRGTRVGGSLSAQHITFQLGTSSQPRGPFNRARDLHIGSTRVVDMAIVGPIDLLDLVQVLLAVVVVRVQDMVVHDLQLVLVRLVVESIRDHVICL